jgi:alpha-beta hydrolase superfamily lysophospholipase
MTDASVSGGGRLIVYVGGLIEKRHDADELFEKLRAEPGHADDEVWVYPDWIRPLTRGSLAVLADTLNQRIGALWAEGGRAREIVLVGHSAGGVLLRYAYLCGRGRLDGHRSAWVHQVTRIVLLAAPNRGVPPSRLNGPTRVAAIMAAGTFRRFAALELLAGAAFMTDLRLEWIRLFNELGAEAPLVVQVRGAADPLVRPEDSRDVEGRATGADLYIPQADHRDIMKVSKVPQDREGQRYDILRRAVLGTVEITEPAALPEQEAEVTDIVFLLHGIRAGINSWVTDLERALQNGTTSRTLVVTASYGWLSAFNFAFPVSRRRTLRWFQDQYSYQFARHPDARIHFVGHSNGTYMFGQSLRQVRTLRFDRVYLAGSVLPREFGWRDFADRLQIATLVNACGSRDKPVGWLCSGLRGLGMRDIGLGGFAGFDVTPSGTVQFLHLDGGHGAGLTAQHLPAVAEYIRDGKQPNPSVTEPSQLFSQVSRLAPLLAVLLVLGLLGMVAWTVVAFSLVKLVAVLGGAAAACLILKAV